MKKKFLSLIPLLTLALLIAVAVHATTDLTNNNTIPTNTQTSTNSQNDWTTANHDINMTRNSPQTTINKDNVNQLQVEWIFNTGYPVENPPLIIGDTAYAQNNAMQIFAIDMKTGLNKWKYDPHTLVNGEIPKSTSTHGMTYNNGVIYAPTGPKNTIIALNATTGKKVWESKPVQTGESYRLPAPPIIWKDYIVVGSAVGDEPPFKPAAKGSVTVLNRTNGHKIWKISTAVGSWVNQSKLNGGATAWSGGAVDSDTGVIYLPIANPSPDFSTKTRSVNTPYANDMIAVNITNGKVLWATPFIAKGTVLNATIPDTHDWDTAWGSHLVTVNINGTNKKVVIGHNKRGDVMAMDAATGKPVWWTNVAYLHRTYAKPSINGSGEVWPATSGGIEDYSAVDNDTLYAAVSNSGANYFLHKNDTTNGYTVPYYKSMPNGVGNGSITAINLSTGKIKWKHDTDTPTWVSPLVTGDIVFSGRITATGRPLSTSNSSSKELPLIPSGIIMAMNKDTGQTIWEYNVGAPVGIGGPSIGQGMLLVPTGSPDEVPTNKGGYIVAFGLP